MTENNNSSQRERAIAAEIEHRRLVRETLGEWWERLGQIAATWDLETVKHLVVLNAAGFAGVATLLAGNKPLQPLWVGAAALLGYGFGVVLAILNMHLGANAFERMSTEVGDRIKKTWNLEESTKGFYDAPKKGRILSVAGQICGWSSALLAVASTIAVGVSLAR
ncbi:conserved membrane hypothetical protein [Cupriavidus necator]|uniref:Uncharacterized protein n=1 Tax=Cupriavidus necator TaxID=106590 RepID=A0A1K0IE96_CUPNE|nr:conserved membrane hypothetical protein [Cupriavidus necator]